MWRIDLNELNERELAEVAEFFRTHRGREIAFDFIDPFTGQTHRGCRLVQDELVSRLAGEHACSTTLIVTEDQSPL